MLRSSHFRDLTELVAVFVGVALAFVLHWGLRSTRWGLMLRLVGDHAESARALGYRPVLVRIAATAAGGFLAGIGGAYLSTSNIASFTPKMSADMGYLALAAVVFGKWRPFYAMLGCLLFGLLFALKNRLNSVNEGFLVQVPGQLFEALPYVLVVVVLAGFVGSARAPKAIGRPYVKERE